MFECTLSIIASILFTRVKFTSVEIHPLVSSVGTWKELAFWYHNHDRDSFVKKLFLNISDNNPVSYWNIILSISASYMHIVHVSTQDTSYIRTYIQSSLFYLRS